MVLVVSFCPGFTGAFFCPLKNLIQILKKRVQLIKKIE